jgi:hypothetical protein
MMVKRILVAGTLGGLTLMVWSAFVNIVFGFAARTQMTPVPNERAVYDLLASQHMAPGAYLANPALVNGRFPDGAPVFGIHYAGFGHETAGLMMLMDLVLWISAGMLAAWLLANASPRVLARYVSRVGYVTAFGVLTVVLAILPRYGIGGLPAQLVLMIATNHLAGWFVSALIIARRLDAPTPTPAR